MIYSEGDTSKQSITFREAVYHGAMKTAINTDGPTLMKQVIWPNLSSAGTIRIETPLRCQHLIFIIVSERLMSGVAKVTSACIARSTKI